MKVGRKIAVKIVKSKKHHKKNSVKTLAKKVKQISKVIKTVEKKRISQTFSYPVGQLNGNGNGYACTDITPYVSSGATYNGRTGSEISVSGIHFDMFIAHQANLSGPVRGRTMIIGVKGTPVSLSTLMAQLFLENGFLGVGIGYRDLNSNMDPDYFANYRILRRVNWRLAPDSFSGQMIDKTIKFGIKFKKPRTVRYQYDSNTVAYGQYFIVTVMDGGNASVSTVNTNATNAPYTAVSTGVNLSCNYTTYYTDL